MTTSIDGSVCPCGSGRAFAECCGPVLDGSRDAATAEALMRSRFTAFAVGDVDHLERSWAPETRPSQIRVDATRRWTRLEILSVVEGRELAATGVVEFRAQYEVDGVAGHLHERSNFRREHGRWVYVAGAVDGAAGD
jgi:SEC-C motif-containing protein